MKTNERSFAGQYHEDYSMGYPKIPQNPLSSPTEKQLLSWLKEAESETGPADSSIAGLVFMADEAQKLWRLERAGTESDQNEKRRVSHEGKEPRSSSDLIQHSEFRHMR